MSKGPNIKGVLQRSSADRNTFTKAQGNSEQKNSSPSSKDLNMIYGIVKEVVGTQVTFIYYDNTGQGGIEVNTPIQVIAPGAESLSTLYGGLQKGLQLRIWYYGDKLDPKIGRVVADVIGGTSDSVIMPRQDPEPKELAMGPFRVFSGGVTGFV